MANQIKQIFLLTFLFTIFAGQLSSVQAASKFVSPVYPIRGSDNWTNASSPFSQTQMLANIVTSNQVSATWLMRFDAMLDPQINKLIKSRQPQDEVGVFMEITKSLAGEADVQYDPNSYWYDANAIFLSGYSINERINLIDRTMNKFLTIYGQYPRTVGAWHIDAFSAKYLTDKYGVTGIIICADQYSTDHYQLWGSYWGVPYIPSLQNILVPANTEDSRMPLVVGQWAARDAVNGYGLSVHQSTHSVQANDYMLHSLDINYFKQIASSYLDNDSNQFGFLLIGIENDYDLEKYGPEVANQLTYVSNRAKKQELEVVQFKQFANWYLKKYSTSPSHTISLNNPLNINELAEWKMDSTHRKGLLSVNGQTTIRDLRNYDSTYPEPFIANRNPHSNLLLTIPAQIDTALNISDNLNPPWKSLWPKYDYIDYVIVIGVSLFILIITFRQFLTPFIIIFVSAIWSLVMIRSGQLMNYGLGFWGPNGHDAIWHLSIASSFQKTFSLENPLLANTKLQNYHFFYDALLAFISRITNLSLITTYFHLMPFLISIIIATLLWFFTKQISNNKTAPMFAIFSAFTAGSAGWIFSLINSKSTGGETTFWAQQSISTLINPPFALSLVILLLFLISFNKYIHKPTINLLFLLAIFVGLLAQTKIYSSILVILGLALLSIEELIRTGNITSRFKTRIINHNFAPITKLLILSCTISFIFLFPFININNSSNSFFVWQPFWFITTMLQDNDRFHWINMANAIQAYQTNHNYPKLFLAFGLSTAIFIIGNFWTRVIGILDYIFNSPNKDYVSKLMFYTFIFGILFPLFFIQKGTSWNTIQFMYYSLFISSIWTAIAISKIKFFFLRNAIFILLIIINIPTTYGTLKHYLPSRSPSRIPTEEMHALNFLKKQDTGHVLSYPYQKELKFKYDEPRPLFAYESTAYISAISFQPSVLEDEVNLEILGLDWKTKRNQIMAFYQTKSLSSAQEFIKDNQVMYFYHRADEPFPYMLHELNARLLYDNGLINIYKIH